MLRFGRRMDGSVDQQGCIWRPCHGIGIAQRFSCELWAQKAARSKHGVTVVTTECGWGGVGRWLRQMWLRVTTTDEEGVMGLG